ncbi:MAG: DUF58 domain-containing protein [Leptolyngbyaceae cyanobacterium RU_5_1]|nr:DUF58 domain-containing protein [Leptolyngbyaceae cyanobacterium RU_5_1]
MRIAGRITDWLETHWVTPAYSGWLIAGLSVFFFIAATNTLSGWLYVISGMGLALLAIAAILPEQNLRQLLVHRVPVHPVSAGEQLMVELLLENRSNQPKVLLQVQDCLPSSLGKPVTRAIESIPAHSRHHWIYCQPTQHRGVYHWQTVQLRTAAPLGLFWCRRAKDVKATAIVYPIVLPLTQCPLIDEMGRDASLLFNSDRRAQISTEGLTRSLRPYRWGDPTRLVHWRTSARYGELRVRELEVFTGGQELIIGLDSDSSWNSLDAANHADHFEQAVIAAASLYFYACQRNLSVKLWTSRTGLIQGNQVVLQALAEIHTGEEAVDTLPSRPLVWLTQNPDSLNTLLSGSRWILWTGSRQATQSQLKANTQTTLQSRRSPGIIVNPNQPLQLQLQNPPRSL